MEKSWRDRKRRYPTGRPLAGACTTPSCSDWCAPGGKLALRNFARPRNEMQRPSNSETVEVIPNFLSWVCSDVPPAPDPTPGAEGLIFSTDDDLVYEPYFYDFGPLNLSLITIYCRDLQRRIAVAEKLGRRIIHYCRPQHNTRANSVLLLCCWRVICENISPDEAIAPFRRIHPSLLPYRDASMNTSCFKLTILHCLQGLSKAIKLRWYDVRTFDVEEYLRYERVENGDLNWIVPGKFLAFSGPTDRPLTYADGVKSNVPETYRQYFKKMNVKTVIRLNNKVYNASQFTNMGIAHYDMYFTDGANPPPPIASRFMKVCEERPGAIAVHCKAGLGRTGTLIGLYIMKHYGLTYEETIAWLRITRPGSVIAAQQLYLQAQEKIMWQAGNVSRAQKSLSDLNLTSPIHVSPPMSRARTGSSRSSVDSLSPTGHQSGSFKDKGSKTSNPPSPTLSKPKSTSLFRNMLSRSTGR